MTSGRHVQDEEQLLGDEPVDERPEADADDHAGAATRDPDDLDGFQTSMSRLSERLRGWLAALLAVMLVVPLGGWLLDELAFRRSGDEVTAALGEDARLADAVVLVRAVGCDGTVSTGSGFLTRLDGEVVAVTNRHVVEGARTVGLRPLEGGQASTAVGYRLAAGADVAVLELGDVRDDAVLLPLGGSPALGQEVRVVGFPAARPYTTAGRVAEVVGGQLVLQLDVAPGASGSPVVDDDGAVVGQVFARTGDGTGGVATAGDALATAVETAEPVEAC